MIARTLRINIGFLRSVELEKKKRAMAIGTRSAGKTEAMTRRFVAASSCACIAGGSCTGMGIRERGLVADMTVRYCRDFAMRVYMSALYGLSYIPNSAHMGGCALTRSPIIPCDDSMRVNCRGSDRQ